MSARTAAELIESANQLAARLERLSADSRWAHRASGLRGSLLRCLVQIEYDQKLDLAIGYERLDQLAFLIEHGYYMLNQAAREISVPDRPK
jgi:hypothetical protein